MSNVIRKICSLAQILHVEFIHLSHKKTFSWFQSSSPIRGVDTDTLTKSPNVPNLYIIQHFLSVTDHRVLIFSVPHPESNILVRYLFLAKNHKNATLLAFIELLEVLGIQLSLLFLPF